MFSSSGHPSSRPPVDVRDDDDLHQTQIQRSVRDYLDEPADIGRAVGNHTRELFVSCEPAEALQQQLEFLRPSYIVLHDIASRGARRMLHAVAAAAGQPVERLHVRRQSYGTTLAGIDHVDCPGSQGRRVRLYSTDIDADSPTRAALTRVLLSRATLAVVLVGDLPPHALGDALQPLRELLFHPQWQCRHLQLMPLPASLSITTQPASVFARPRSNSTTGQPLSARRPTSRPEASAGAMMMPSTFFDRKSRIRAFSRSVSEFEPAIISE